MRRVDGKEGNIMFPFPKYNFFLAAAGEKGEKSEARLNGIGD